MIEFVARSGAVVLLAAAATTSATAGESPPSIALEHVNEPPSATKGQSQNLKADSSEPQQKRPDDVQIHMRRSGAEADDGPKKKQ